MAPMIRSDLEPLLFDSTDFNMWEKVKSARTWLTKHRKIDRKRQQFEEEQLCEQEKAPKTEGGLFRTHIIS